MIPIPDIAIIVINRVIVVLIVATKTKNKIDIEKQMYVMYRDLFRTLLHQKLMEIIIIDIQEIRTISINDLLLNNVDVVNISDTTFPNAEKNNTLIRIKLIRTAVPQIIVSNIL